MDFFLNKIDPQVVKAVNETTASGTIHRKDDVPIRYEDGNEEKEKKQKKRKSNLKDVKKKVEELNQIADEKALDIFFEIEAENYQLIIKVYEKNSDRCIRTFDEDEIEELLSRLQNISGIIVDVKR